MPANQLPGRALGLALAIATLASCGNELEDLSDSELQHRAHQCRVDGEQTPGRAIACDNYTRECRRRRDSGRYVC